MMVRNISQFMIAAPTSGSGKTTISRGLMALLIKKGLKVQPFKCGPDYIDTKYHADVCNRPSINLDTFMASKEHVRKLYAHHAGNADACIVEGMMGMFDGYDRDKGSTAEIAELLHLPIILVVDAKSTAYSMAPLLSGFIHFRPEVQIAGVVFNRVGSPRHYEMLQEVCTDLNIACLGYLPKNEQLEQASRYLGLNFSQTENTGVLGLLMDLLEEHIDWKLLLEKTSLPIPEPQHEEDKEPGNLRILVAQNEESFSFLYEEHLEILRRLGTVTFFNPEHNRPISQKTDLLYLPGGYPENTPCELAKAWRTKDSIRKYVEAGGKVLAECGGMIYLSYAIEYNGWLYHEDSSEFARMVGIFPFYISGKREYTKLTLGYRQFDYNNQHLRGHEFHYTQFGQVGSNRKNDESDFEGYIKEFSIPDSVAQVYNAKDLAVQTPIFRYKNVIASYTHLYWGEIDIMKLF